MVKNGWRERVNSMTGSWIDAHCHLADQRLAADIEQVIEHSRHQGVTSWVQGGVGPRDWERQQKLRKRFGKSVLPSFGLHPWWVTNHSEAEIDSALHQLHQLLPSRSSHAVAIGEIGLDLHPKRLRHPNAFTKQLRAFEAELRLAKQVRLPVIIHSVRSDHHILDALTRLGPFPNGGLIHSFSGTVSHGLAFIERGFHLSLSGAQLSSAKRLRSYAELPIDQIVIETDAPDQLPRGWGGGLNEPANLLRIANAWANTWQTTGAMLLDNGRIILEALFALPTIHSPITPNPVSSPDPASHDRKA